MSACQVRKFGTVPDGREVYVVKLSLSNRFSASFSTLGASLVAIETADQHGQFGDVVLACDDAGSQWHQQSYLGAFVGRNAGRIRNARFDLEGQTYLVTRNHGHHHLHGGETGLSRKIWTIHPGDDSIAAATFTTSSADGEEGYPGELIVEVTYRLEDPSTLAIETRATTTKTTLFNPTSHGYFNLGGHASGQICDHLLSICSDHHVEFDDQLLATGHIASVRGTPLDFTTAKRIDRDMAGLPMGYDHNFVLRDGPGLRLAAVLSSPSSGRTMSLVTDRRCLQFYTGGYLDVADGKAGASYGPLSGLCLEPQGYPDSLNQEDFPAALLRAGEEFRSTTKLIFEVENAQ